MLEAFPGGGETGVIAFGPFLKAFHGARKPPPTPPGGPGGQIWRFRGMFCLASPFYILSSLFSLGGIPRRISFHFWDDTGAQFSEAEVRGQKRAAFRAAFHSNFGSAQEFGQNRAACRAVFHSSFGKTQELGQKTGGILCSIGFLFWAVRGHTHIA